MRRSQIEARVLLALEQGLMRPDLVAAFVAEFTAEWNRLRAEASLGLRGVRRELAGVERQLQGLIEMMIDGFRAPGLQDKLNQFELRKAELNAAIAAGEQANSLPRLHGNLSETYRLRLGALREALAGGGNTEILEALRALVDRVLVHPSFKDAAAPLELIGHLSALLEVSGAPAEMTAGLSLVIGQEKTPPAVADGVCSAKWDAGTGFEPVTFRL
ncbi:MAG: putative recombinase [Rubritepida sp.]|nr:putative recombinase [Rubritepida sp.]